MKNFHVRQGDVLLERIESMPAGVKKVKRENGRLIIARGEVTGHCHAIEEKSAELFVDKDGKLFISVEEEVDLVHEEHGTITLPAGVYVYVPQREYAPEEIRKVLD